MDELSPTAHTAAVLVAKTLEPQGWSIEPRRTRTGVSIRLEHPLTTPLDVNFPNDDCDHRQFVTGILAQREFAVIARAPSTVEHASLLRRLRDVASANSWDRHTLALVARVLEGEGVLSAAESEWLEDAGPAWEVE
jgi:hypothetical protein